MADRITLNERDFRVLVAGGVVNYGPVLLLLADIGFDKMLAIITAAQRKQWAADDARAWGHTDTPKG